MEPIPSAHRPSQIRAGSFRPGSGQGLLADGPAAEPPGGGGGRGTERDLVTVGEGRETRASPLSSFPSDSSGTVRVTPLDPGSAHALWQATGRVPGVWLSGTGGPPPAPTREDEGRGPVQAWKLQPRPLPTPGPRRSHGHFCLAGCVAGVVARDVVQLFHGVVSARGEGLALGRRAALAQGGVRVIRGTGMRVHLGHAVAVQHRRGHEDIRVRDGPRQGLLREGRPLRGQQRVLGVQALRGEQLLVREEAVVGQAEVVRQASLQGKDPVLRHGPEGPAGSLARQRLLLGHLDDVEGEGAAGRQVRQVPPPHVVLVSLLVGCRGETG